MSFAGAGVVLGTRRKRDRNTNDGQLDGGVLHVEPTPRTVGRGEEEGKKKEFSGFL